MLSTFKVATAAKAVAAKAITAKAMVGAGVLAGSAATGFVAVNGLPTDYLDSASQLIDQAVSTEANSVTPQPLETGRTMPARDGHSTREEAAPQIKASVGGANTEGIDPALPHVLIVAHRMRYIEKLAYDTGYLAEMQLAQR